METSNSFHRRLPPHRPETTASRRGPTTRWRATAAILIGSLAATSALSAQTGAPHALGRLLAQSPSEFNRIIAMRELSDGSLLVLDEGDQRIVLLSSDLLSPRPLLRTGDGPGEYRRVGSLHALPNDTTLFVDGFNGRISILQGARFLATLSERETAVMLFQQEVLGADRLGHLLGAPALSGNGRAPGPRAAADSLQLLLSSRLSPRIDSIARIKGRGTGRIQMVREEGRAPFMYVGSPLSSQDEAVLFIDGWIAVAYLHPYRVDWRDPSGRWVRGEPIERTPGALTREQQCLAWQRIFSGTRPCRPDLLSEWPASLPPFLSSTSNLGAAPLLLEHSGLLAIRRTPSTAVEQPRFDLVDRRGRRIGQITLQRGESLLGFGKNAAYLIATDEDGVQRVRKHDWK